ncbi:DeoR/GlpR family DNA-binding transcription regulator [Paracoccus sp. Z330]|uniref:DeoR/GlpR family DNA-binding transcription regulator n=1 Tax=Paracoccus onchidii TaxID=3017813 RepID=A0ABT4ZHZ8_9RHOB|nr:DeoR/GlpR family DNA-binding transcription regulator [Paracoccus onchidii]MDB6178350.1 DeoR/GlpR family DNA-binding transcription regulator [Paracoccus onchidii]
MGRPSGRSLRVEEMKKLCASGAIVHIGEAARQLQTSEITIRRDLSGQDSGLLCLGGYIMFAEGAGERYSLSRAQDTNAGEKQRLARKAAKLIEPGDTIFIDCGSTLQYLAAAVPEDANVTVVTQALNIADEIAKRRGVSLILLAGHYHPESGSFSSQTALDMLAEVNITKGFFSAAGVHERAGVTCFHFHEVAVKRHAIRRSHRRILVCDPSKLGRSRPATFGDLSDFEIWIGQPGSG